jgi:hypothetical protein
MVIKFNGWDLISTKNGKYSIFYEAGLIGETGGMVYISEEIYNDAKNGNIDLKSLFDKYNLYDYRHIGKSKKVSLDPTNYRNTPIKYYGRGLIATDENGRYFMKYQKATHGGGSRKIEISKQAYEDIRVDDLSASEVIIKYNLRHLDIPENDVKE